MLCCAHFYYLWMKMGFWNNEWWIRFWVETWKEFLFPHLRFETISSVWAAAVENSYQTHFARHFFKNFQGVRTLSLLTIFRLQIYFSKFFPRNKKLNSKSRFSAHPSHNITHKKWNKHHKFCHQIRDRTLFSEWFSVTGTGVKK